MNNEEIKQATEKVIREMLTESTGRHMLDSGGIYGRHWEKNQQNGLTTGVLECDYYTNDDTKETNLIPTIPIFDAFSKTLIYTQECKEIEKKLPYLNFDVLHWIENEIHQGKIWDK